MAHGSSLPQVKIINPDDLKDKDLRDLVEEVLVELSKQTMLLWVMVNELQDEASDDVVEADDLSEDLEDDGE